MNCSRKNIRGAENNFCLPFRCLRKFTRFTLKGTSIGDRKSATPIAAAVRRSDWDFAGSETINIRKL